MIMLWTYRAVVMNAWMTFDNLFYDLPNNISDPGGISATSFPK